VYFLAHFQPSDDTPHHLCISYQEIFLVIQTQIASWEILLKTLGKGAKKKPTKSRKKIPDFYIFSSLHPSLINPLVT
jgi:hypothetical protein